MFTKLLPLFATTAALIGSGMSPEATLALTAPAAPIAAPAPLPTVSARLYISYAGNGYYNVVIDGKSSAANASVGAIVYGEDTWLDDRLFSMGGGYTKTDFTGAFNFGIQVHKSWLNEDWEGTDEIYAVVSVSGGGSSRTNTISKSF